MDAIGRLRLEQTVESKVRNIFRVECLRELNADHGLIQVKIFFLGFYTMWVRDLKHDHCQSWQKGQRNNCGA